ncbi:MAG: cytochrome C, partial [Cyclobacteriaceae bacterium]|nr:cytochrome C [Cyclobacteriaceae bacterium]
DKKNIQPTSWGSSYFCDSLKLSKWTVTRDGAPVQARIVNKGYRFSNEQVTLSHQVILPGGDTIQVLERPEYVADSENKPGLERLFTTSNVPEGVVLTLFSQDTLLTLKPNAQTLLTTWFAPRPMPSPPTLAPEYDHMGMYWMEKSDCFTCHETEEKTVGPSFRQIAERYDNNRETLALLAEKVITGGTGNWGTALMNPHPNLSSDDVQNMLKYIFSLKPKEETPRQTATIRQQKTDAQEKLPASPGFGAPLEGLHPGYDLITIRKNSFKPKVGGMEIMPDGRLLVSTWDSIGGVYILDHLETNDTSKITVKRIAAGLAEPLGIEVVNGDIFVVQKHELTQLIDHDGDEVIDEYRAICNSYGVTDDFHEFAFGPVYKDGYFYMSLSLAMRMMSNERQQPDRGRVIKISRNGDYEWINYGLRTPNGIGLGPENELFVTDNQGQWLPANKLIHVKKGDFHGMRWIFANPDEAPEMTPPTLWLPEDEIGNSPSDPLLVTEGPYKGQLLHGDVTHGGLKRDFLEKVNGEYQGAVFRFSQGFEAGINRICYAPDGGLYLGGVGMVGGWSWKENQYGLQKIVPNGKTAFEVLAIRALPRGFELEFTTPLAEGHGTHPEDYLVQQWWYLPTARYGGPKMDLENMAITELTISEDRKKVTLTIPGLKEKHVVYFRLKESLKDEGGRSLWSGEAWYTLNVIPGI